jgi:hypothetical protein
MIYMKGGLRKLYVTNMLRQGPEARQRLLHGKALPGASHVKVSMGSELKIWSCAITCRGVQGDKLIYCPDPTGSKLSDYTSGKLVRVI